MIPTFKKNNRFKPNYKVINFELPDFKTEKEKELFFLYLKKIGAIQDYKIKNEILILKIKSKKLYFYEFAGFKHRAYRSRRISLGPRTSPAINKKLKSPGYILSKFLDSCNEFL